MSWALYKDLHHLIINYHDGVLLSQQQAEQDNEQRKKQEIAAEEQAAPSPKKKDGTPQKVYLQYIYICIFIIN